jgi:hypothetical protein
MRYTITQVYSISQETLIGRPATKLCCLVVSGLVKFPPAYDSAGGKIEVCAIAYLWNSTHSARMKVIMVDTGRFDMWDRSRVALASYRDCEKTELC